MEQVKLYDTTLRDGMQGEGMSLSAGEKLRVVHALDELGVHFIEAGFPSSNPKEVELFELLAEQELEQATICAFGMTRRRDVAAEDDAALRDAGRLLRAGRDAGRQDLGAAPREGDQGLPRGEPGDDRRLGRLLPRAGQAGRLRRRALLRRLPRRPRLRAGVPPRGGRGGRRERHPLRHQRRQPARPVAEATAAVVEALGDGVEVGIHTHNDAECGSPTRSPRSTRGRPPRAGHDQRLRRALRQRQPGLDPAGAAAEDGLRGASPPSSWRA